MCHEARQKKNTLAAVNFAVENPKNGVFTGVSRGCAARARAAALLAAARDHPIAPVVHVVHVYRLAIS